MLQKIKFKMQKRLSNIQLKSLYKLDEGHKWMEIINEAENDHPCFKTYVRQKKRLENLLKYIKFNKGYNVVEFGCGNGIFGELICRKVRHYTGVDFSEPFVKLARKRHDALGVANSKFVCDDIVKFSDGCQNQYDQAYSMDFTEHIYDDDFLSIFKAIRSTLKEGGELYIHTPNGDSFLELLKKYGVLKQVTGHIGIRNNKEYTNLLRKTGFSKIEVSYLPHYIKLLSVFHFLSYIPIFGKFFRARLFIKCTK